MKVQTEIMIERKDVSKRFGAVNVENLAATLYHAFHGDCQCVSHPFYHDHVGEFDGQLPWDEMKPNDGDDVIQAFRLAALSAYETLRTTGIGSLK